MRSLKVRFNEEFIPEPNSGCFIWIANKNNKGYGMIRAGGKQRKVLAHRVSYQLKHGDICDNINVLHTCDNPSCVNPEHLFLGTMRDNYYDMVSKGRRKNSFSPHNKPPIYYGCDHPEAKFSQNQVDSIRSRIISGESGRAIARELSVNKSTIYKLRDYKTYFRKGVCYR